MKKIQIDGANFSDLKGFYIEVENRLTSGLGWEIGRNLDAFGDFLEGGFGVHNYGEELELTWTNSNRSRLKLGNDETVKYFRQKLVYCHPTAKREVRIELESAKNEIGDTLFEIIVDTIREHQHITLRLD